MVVGGAEAIIRRGMGVSDVAEVALEGKSGEMEMRKGYHGVNGGEARGCLTDRGPEADLDGEAGQMTTGWTCMTNPFWFRLSLRPASHCPRLTAVKQSLL